MEQIAEQSAVPQKKIKKKLKWWYSAKKRYTGESNKTGWEVSTYYRKFLKPTISFRISPASYFDNRLMIHLDLLWISWYIHLPIYSTIDECEYPEFGFYYHMNSLVLCWNMKKKFIHMPWSYEWVRTSRLLKDGSWLHETKGKRRSWKEEDYKWEKENTWQETHPYIYVTDKQEIQDDIQATIRVTEREWRQKWLMWTNLGAKIHKDIDVEFSKEVGSERGSWKGGVLGTGHKMKPNETPLQTLRRMQRERSFCR